MSAVAPVLPMLLAQTRSELVARWRVPAFSVTSLALPILFYTFFALPFARQTFPNGVSVGAYLLASFAAYAVGSVMVYGFGINVAIERADRAWSTDITYVPMPSGFMYLAATIDWFSRYVVAWRLSNTLDGSFCLEMLDEALSRGKPEVFNTDQGVPFTSSAWTGRLEGAGVSVSMDGRGRCLDNVFVERLWRTVKYEEIYLNDYPDIETAIQRLRQYFEFYNRERPHQSLRYKTPEEVYRSIRNEE